MPANRDAPERGSELHWPQELPAKILITTAQGSLKAMDGSNETQYVLNLVCPTNEETLISPQNHIRHADALNMKSKTSFLTPCQGFLTSNTFMRSRKVSPASVFCSPSGNTVKNGAAQLPFSMSHLDDSHPYGGGGGGCWRRMYPLHLDSQKKKIKIN